MTQASRTATLQQSGLIHPRPEDVTAALFDGRLPFFLAQDKVQVKYEMLRAHVVDGVSVRCAALDHGYCRASFYLVAASFSESGMAGLVDEKRGRRGPVKLRPEIVDFIKAADPTQSGAELARAISGRFGVSLHRRTIERVRVP